MPHRDSTRMVTHAGTVRCIRLLGRWTSPEHSLAHPGRGSPPRSPSGVWTSWTTRAQPSIPIGRGPGAGRSRSAPRPARRGQAVPRPRRSRARAQRSTRTSAGSSGAMLATGRPSGAQMSTARPNVWLDGPSVPKTSYEWPLAKTDTRTGPGDHPADRRGSRRAARALQHGGRREHVRHLAPRPLGGRTRRQRRRTDRGPTRSTLTSFVSGFDHVASRHAPRTVSGLTSSLSRTCPFC